RAQTMFGDSYVFVVFEDGTDLYWARSRVLEYMQQITGRLPAGVHPVIGPDATGAGWVYEYVLVDHSQQRSLADLRSLQDCYLRSLSDLETVPVAAKNGTPVLIRNLGTVTFGPDIREGVAEWQGEGETVAGIVVMRDGMNALSVIDGVKRKLGEIKPSLPPGVEVVAGYDRSGLIHASIATLQRDLLEEAIIVSIVIIIFLFHFRSALIP